MGESVKNRRHSAEFRIEIAQRMLAGEPVMGLSRRHGLARSMMYRWRAAYREKGISGLSRPPGRVPARAPDESAAATRGAPAKSTKVEEQLRQKVAELERKVGQQAVEIDFFKRVFKRLDELPKTRRSGGDASTGKSDE